MLTVMTGTKSRIDNFRCVLLFPISTSTADKFFIYDGYKRLSRRFCRQFDQGKSGINYWNHWAGKNIVVETRNHSDCRVIWKFHLGLFCQNRFYREVKVLYYRPPIDSVTLVLSHRITSSWPKLLLPHCHSPIN